MRIEVDGIGHELERGQLLCLTPSRRIRVESHTAELRLRMLSFSFDFLAGQPFLLRASVSEAMEQSPCIAPDRQAWRSLSELFDFLRMQLSRDGFPSRREVVEALLFVLVAETSHLCRPAPAPARRPLRADCRRLLCAAPPQLPPAAQPEVLRRRALHHREVPHPRHLARHGAHARILDCELPAARGQRAAALDRPERDGDCRAAGLRLPVALRTLLPSHDGVGAALGAPHRKKRGIAERAPRRPRPALPRTVPIRPPSLPLPVPTVFRLLPTLRDSAPPLRPLRPLRPPPRGPRPVPPPSTPYSARIHPFSGAFPGLFRRRGAPFFADGIWLSRFFCIFIVG